MAEKENDTLKRYSRNSFTMKRIDERENATIDVPPDLVVCISDTSFSLHKFPLVSKSGLIRKLVAETKNSNLHLLELSDIPGGAEAFELAAKFCYGISLKITNSNVARLRCVAEHLEMTDDYAEDNLVTRTEAFLKEAGTQSLPNAIAVLHTCENLLPLAEELKIVTRCIDAAALFAFNEDAFKFQFDRSFPGQVDTGPDKRRQFNTSWAKDLSVLRLDFYTRVLAAMKSQGVHHESIWETLMHYAQCSLRGFTWNWGGLCSTMQAEGQESSKSAEHKQRILLETLVSLLPARGSTTSCGFLFCLLRAAVVLDTTVASRLDLERRISMQLEDATLDDLLIPSPSHNAETVFDVDLVQRLFLHSLAQQGNKEFFDTKDLQGSDGKSFPVQGSILKIGKLLDSYLAEIATDANLKLNKFLAVAELLPEHGRSATDGLYRAIDIYLKAHATVSELDRNKLCKLLNPQKLSPEACAHAAQNERLHAKFMIRVLYAEHLKLCTTLADFLSEREQLGKLLKVHSREDSATLSPRETFGVLCQENKELKLELARMRTAIANVEKDQKQDTGKPAIVSNTLFQAVSKKLGRLSRFSRTNSKEQKTLSVPEHAKSRNSRHSIS